MRHSCTLMPVVLLLVMLARSSLSSGNLVPGVTALRTSSPYSPRHNNNNPYNNGYNPSWRIPQPRPSAASPSTNADHSPIDVITSHIDDIYSSLTPVHIRPDLAREGRPTFADAAKPTAAGDRSSSSNRQDHQSSSSKPIPPQPNGNAVFVDARITSNTDDTVRTVFRNTGTDIGPKEPNEQRNTNTPGHSPSTNTILNTYAIHNRNRNPEYSDITADAYDTEPENRGHDTNGGENDQGGVNSDQDGDEYDKLAKVDANITAKDLGMNVVPDGSFELHHHYDHNHDGYGLHHHDYDSSSAGHEHASDDTGSNNNSPDARSIGDHSKDLCDYCLCDINHSIITCESRHTQPHMEHLVLNASLVPETAKTLIVRSFNHVTVQGGTFAREQSTLQFINFENIDTLELHTRSLHFSPHARENMVVEVSIKHSNMTVIPSYTMTQLEEREVNTDSHHHNDLSLEKTRFLTLRLYRCEIGDMESHAFYRARMLYFNFTDVMIGSMSEKSIDLDVYEEWVVQKSRLPHMPRNAICIHAEKSVVFSRNFIEELDPLAWKIKAEGQVLFEYNTVRRIRGRAFLNIEPMDGSRSANIVFLNNTVIAADPGALVTSDLYPRHERKVLHNRFKLLCECNISVYFKEMLDIKENDTYDILLYEAVMMNSLCKPYASSNHYIIVSGFIEAECSPVPVTLILIASFVATGMILSIATAVVCAKKAKKAQDEVSYLEECSSRSFSTMNTQAAPLSPGRYDNTANIFYDSQGNPSWIMAVPEIKTYQETEVHVTYEESRPIAPSERVSYQDSVLDLQRTKLTRQSCPFN